MIWSLILVGASTFFLCVCVKVLRSKTAYDIKICFQIKRSWILIILFIIILLFLNYSGKLLCHMWAKVSGDFFFCNKYRNILKINICDLSKIALDPIVSGNL